LGEIRPVSLAGQALELSRRFLSLIRKLPLAGAAALTHLPRKRLLARPFGLLLLAPRELAQLLHQRINLLIGLLLLRALRRLILIGQLVEILLEQIREIFGHRACAATTAAASAATAASTSSASTTTAAPAGSGQRQLRECVRADLGSDEQHERMGDG
jgi:hypothetical protein